MKTDIKRMYDAVKAIEIEELKKKLESVGGEFEFKNFYLVVTYLDSDDEEHDAHVEKAFLRCGKPFLTVSVGDFESVNIDCECVAYGQISCLADEIIPEREVQICVDCTLFCTEKETEELLSGDDKKAARTTKSILEKGHFDTAYVEIQ